MNASKTEKPATRRAEEAVGAALSHMAERPTSESPTRQETGISPLIINGTYPRPQRVWAQDVSKAMGRTSKTLLRIA